MALGTLAYSKVIGALASGGQWHDACKVLSRISECDLPFNPRVVSLALGACADVEAGGACEAGRAAFRVLRAVLKQQQRRVGSTRPRGPAGDGDDRARQSGCSMRLANGPRVHAGARCGGGRVTQAANRRKRH